MRLFLSAKNVWRRHELLESTIGILPEEQLSYDNITSVYYVAVVLVPTLSLMEILLYCIYQCKVHLKFLRSFHQLNILLCFLVSSMEVGIFWWDTGKFGDQPGDYNRDRKCDSNIKFWYGSIEMIKFWKLWILSNDKILMFETTENFYLFYLNNCGRIEPMQFVDVVE